MTTPARCPFGPSADACEAPPSPSRRRLFHEAALAGSAVLLGGLPGAAQAADPGIAGSPAAVLPAAVDPARETRPFHGVHQSGIVDAAPVAGLVASFDVLAADRRQLGELLRLLTDRFAFLTGGGAAATADPAFPPPDSGILGPDILPHGLTATLSVGASLFDDRFGLAPLKPRSLTRMMAFPNDRLDGDSCHGDLLIQFCSNAHEANLHALRDVIKNTPSALMLRWKQDGFLPEFAVRSGGRETPRNLLGFKDGTANPDPADGALMDEVVWVRPGGSEPPWTAGGTYHVVRLIRMLVEQWDRTPLLDQEQIIGRHKDSGAPLGLQHEHDAPDFAADAGGRLTPLDAHIRLANPRTAETRGSLILRRGYNYSRGVSKSGQLDMGLLFACFQSDLAAGFIAVQERLNGEPFEEYIKPIGGGYFFALPGVPGPGHYLGQGLLEAAAA